MGLNAAGLTALLDDGNEAVFFAAIGSGPTAAEQTSNERLQLTLGAPAAAVITVTNVPLAFTGTPGAAATHVLLFDDVAGSTFRGFAALTGDQAFNAAGQYNVDSLTLTGSSPA